MTTKMKPLLLAPKKGVKISKELQKKIDEANSAFANAAVKVKAAYEYAIRVDRLTPQEAKLVLFRNLRYSPAYIRKYLPANAKVMTQARFGESNPKIRAKKKRMEATAAPKKEIIVDQNVVRIPSDFNVQEAITLPVDTRGRENLVLAQEENEPVVLLRIVPGLVKQFYEELDRVKAEALVKGLQIHSDLHVVVMT